MASRYLLESGAPDGYQLEDGSGVYLLEGSDGSGDGTGGQPRSYPFMHRRVIERTSSPQQVFTTIVDSIVRTWIPATAALLACAVPAAAKEDQRYYDTQPSAAFFPLTPAGPSDAQTAPAIQQESRSYRTADGRRLDVRTYESYFDPSEWQSHAPVVARWAPAIQEESRSYRTPDGKRLDVRSYEWEWDAGQWLGQTVAPVVAQWASAFSSELSSFLTASRPTLDVRRFEWEPDTSWVFVTLPQGPTVAQMAPAWITQAQNFRITYRRYFVGLPGTDGRQSGGDSNIQPPEPPTTAQTAPAWAFTGDRTRSVRPLDLFRAQSIPDIFGVPDNWIDWVHQQDRGGLTRDRARLDVRRYEWGQPPWIFANLPAPPITDAQKWPAILDKGLSYRTGARPTLDVRGFEWQPEFTWARSVVDAAIAKFAGIYTSELAGYRTGDRARLEVRAYEWRPWVQGVAAPAATVAQTLPAWAFSGDRTIARPLLDVRAYEWRPAFTWLHPVLAPALYSPAFLQNLGTQYQTPARAKLDVRGYEWLPEFGWAARVVDGIVSKWIAVFDAEVSFRTSNGPWLDVRRITDAPELAWLDAVIVFIPPPEARADVIVMVLPDVGVIQVRPDVGIIRVLPDVGDVEA